MNRRPRSFLPWTLLGSVAVHAAVLLLIGWVFTQQFVDKKDAQGPMIEMDLPLVQTERALKPSDNQDKAKFGGEFRQRVDKQMRAPKNGLLTQQRGAKGSEADAPRHPDGMEEDVPTPRLKLSELMQPPASPNSLPDEIALGDSTLLNTDSVSFASFINRVMDEIYAPWVEYAREATKQRQLKGTMRADTYITKLAISMDDSGRVIAIQILKSSGNDELDDAPKRAFWDRDPFPHPPEKMRKQDGVIRFTCEFHFELKNSIFSIIPQAI